ncbi:hypothetical protein [Andreprevotia lacus]|uniref:hypothetical protein n=1 Tax=Andreprevotia lacus TaxID=1121000 RepID=UPI001C390316|nr:hypothetical protein [Andreprevotia lacus]
MSAELERALIDRHGPMLPSRVLWKVLGYSSAAAWRQSIRRQTVPVPIFKLEGRSGYFALSRDVAQWMAQQRMTATEAADQKGGMS